MNTQMTDEEAKRDHHLYDPSKSKTASKLVGQTFDIQYGDKSHASGPVFTDVMDIGGATVYNQAIGLPSKIAASLAEDKTSDGLVGLAMTKLNTIRPRKQKTFFENLADDLDEPVFTAQLRHGQMGSYEFGAVDKAKYHGDLIKVPVINENGFWEIRCSLYSVGQLDKIQKIQNGTGTAILDTGTTLLVLDEEIVKSYYAQVPGSRYDPTRFVGWVYPCNSPMPSLFLAVGDDHMAIIPSSLLTFQSYGPDADGVESTSPPCLSLTPFFTVCSFADWSSMLWRPAVQQCRGHPDPRRRLLQGSLCRLRPPRPLCLFCSPCLMP